jgi:pilus assembly protein CpaE
MSAGARDFLPIPVGRDVLRQALISALETEERRRIRHASNVAFAPRGIVVTVFGPKGGIGKTTVVTNLSVSLAREGQSVVAVDADAGFGDVTGMLDIQPERTIVELSQHIDEVTRETLPRFLLPHASGLMVLAAPPMALDWRNVSTESFDKIIDALARSFDVVIVDTSGTLDEISLAALKAASFVLWITTTDYSSVKDSQAALRALRQMSFPQDHIRLLLNETSSVNDVRPAAVSETLEQPVFWRIPYDRQLRRSAQLGKAVVEVEPSSKIAQNFRDLAQRISGQTPAPKPAGLTRFRGKKRGQATADEAVIAPALRREET